MLPSPNGRAAPPAVAVRESIPVHLAAATPLRKIAGLKLTATGAARQPEAEGVCPGSRTERASATAEPRKAEYSVVADSIRGPATARTAAWTYLTARVVELRKTPACSVEESLQVLSGHKSATLPNRHQGCPRQARFAQWQPTIGAGG